MVKSAIQERGHFPRGHRMTAAIQRRAFRSIWISDIHLGTRDCNAEFLLEFLRVTECDFLYLVGDIVDGWQLRRSWFWPQAHNDLIQKLLRKGRKGTRVVYVPGNHDEFARHFVGNCFGAVEVVDEAIHETADGRRLLVVHGDSFDGVMRCARWLAVLGDRAYGLALTVNRWFNQVRRRLGLPYWSLSAFLKLKVKNAVKYIGDYEAALLEAARLRRVDGIVCGHIHHAELRQVGDRVYANCGDWVESCTALVEHLDGRLEIIQWAASVGLAAVPDAAEPWSAAPVERVPA